MQVISPAYVDVEPRDFRGWPVHALGSFAGRPLHTLEVNDFWERTGKVVYRRGVHEGQVGWPASLMVAKAGFHVASFNWANYSVVHTDLLNIDVTALRGPWLRTNGIMPFTAWRFRQLGSVPEGINGSGPGGPAGCVGFGFIAGDGGYGLDVRGGSIPAINVEGTWLWNNGNQEQYNLTPFAVEVGYGNPTTTLARTTAGYDWPAFS